MSVQRLLDRVAAGTDALHRGRLLDQRRRAPDFSPFEFMDARETRLSHILGWMLDPSGSHGQGDAFLRCFLDLVGPEWSDVPTPAARVRREVPTRHLDSDRRLDILVEGQGWALAIENKPYAGDQPDQVTDYLVQLDALRRERIALVYLSGNGSPPSEGALPAEERERRGREVRVLGYADLEPWFDECCRACEAERVSAFLGAFRRVVRTKVRGVTDMSDHEEVLAVVGSSPEMVDAAMQVAAAARTIRVGLLARLKPEIEALVDARWTVEADFSKPSWSLLTVSYDDSLPTRFTVQFHNGSGRFDQLTWGLWHPEGGLGDVTAISAAMSTRFGRGWSSEWWAWARTASPTDVDLPLEHNWEVTARPWVALARRQVAPLIATAAREVYEVLRAQGSLTAPRGRPPKQRG